jgi:S-(hydroxymethyl)glutathione dehydrogenase/alcohol dehydrogenase
VLRVVGEPVVVETIHLKTVGPDDVWLGIDRTGGCRSDLSLACGLLQQPVPAALGHEACGTIVEFGESVVDLDVKQRVVLLWITPCRHCFHCAQGESHLCSTHPSA